MLLVLNNFMNRPSMTKSSDLRSVSLKGICFKTIFVYADDITLLSQWLNWKNIGGETVL